MANHSITVVGPSVRDAFKNTVAQLVDEMPKVAERHFTALKRILEKQEPEYAS